MSFGQFFGVSSLCLLFPSLGGTHAGEKIKEHPLKGRGIIALGFFWVLSSLLFEIP